MDRMGMDSMKNLLRLGIGKRLDHIFLYADCRDFWEDFPKFFEPTKVKLKGVV